MVRKLARIPQMGVISARGAGIMTPMDRLAEFRRNAEDAERLASMALSTHERESYERIAKGWRELLKAEEITRKRGR